MKNYSVDDEDDADYSSLLPWKPLLSRGILHQRDEDLLLQKCEVSRLQATASDWYHVWIMVWIGGPQTSFKRLALQCALYDTILSEKASASSRFSHWHFKCHLNLKVWCVGCRDIQQRACRLQPTKYPQSLVFSSAVVTKNAEAILGLLQKYYVENIIVRIIFQFLINQSYLNTAFIRAQSKLKDDTHLKDSLFPFLLSDKRQKYLLLYNQTTEQVLSHGHLNPSSTLLPKQLFFFLFYVFNFIVCIFITFLYCLIHFSSWKYNMFHWIILHYLMTIKLLGSHINPIQ